LRKEKHVIELSERSTKGGSGPTAIEYGLIAVGISVTIIMGLHVFGSQLKATYSRVASQLLPSSAVDVTGTIGASEVASSWDRQGVTRIILGQSETINARKYSIPVQPITKANAIISPTPIAPGGQRNAVAAATATAAAVPLPTAAAGSGHILLSIPSVHVVASGDTLSKIARKYRVPLKTLIVANGIQPETPLMIGTKLAIPSRTTVTPEVKNKPIKEPLAKLQ
jgi:LysM repeat protein/Flp pilus assembly pilin Flp